MPDIPDTLDERHIREALAAVNVIRCACGVIPFYVLTDSVPPAGSHSCG